jgi:PAS domain S-box-containing protein
MRLSTDEEISSLAKFPSENPNPVLRVAKDGTVLYANEASLPLLDTWGCQVSQCVPDDCRKFILDALGSGISKDTEIECGDRIFSLTFAPVVGPDYVNLYGLDITERKQAEEVLRDSEERYRRIVDTAQEGIYVVDTELKIGFVNKQMAQMLGYSVEEMHGRHLIDFMDDISPVETYRDFHWDKQEIKTPHDFRFRRKDGSELWGMISSSPVYDNNGKFVGALGMVVDVNERKEAERALRKANEELKAFIDIVSHDLKNPIFSIRGFSTLLLRNYEKQLGDKGRGYLDVIDASARQMDRLVSDLLVLSRLGEVVPNLRSVIFHQIIDKAVSTFQGRLEEMGIELVVGQNLPIIYCDGERMYQVFENLLSNAIRFAGNAEKPKIEIGYEDEGEHHRFYVRDNGVGIDQKHHRRIFQMFQRVPERGNEEGTGLGLAIVDRIVRQHGGEVWVESEVGEGATFHFILPK